MFKLFNENRWMFQLIPKTKKLFIFNFILMLISNLISVIMPLFFSLMIDSIFLHKSWTSFIRYVILYSSFYSLTLVISIVTEKLNLKITKDFTNKFKSLLFEKTLSLKAQELFKLNTGDVIYTINNNVGNILNFLNSIIFSTILSIIYIVILFVIMITIRWEIAIVIILFSILIVFLSDLFKRKFSVLKKEYREEYSRYSGWMIEILNGIQDIQVNNAENYITKLFSNFVLSLLRSKEKARFLEIKVERLNGFIMAIFTVAFWIVSALFVVGGSITIGVFLALEQYFNIVIGKINQIRSAKIEYHNFRPDFEKISEFFHMPNEELDYNDQDQLSLQSMPISIDNVCFQYTEGVPVLKNINISIKKGEFVALVGVNGEGKSTLMGLLIKFYTQQSGSIYIGQFNIKDISIPDLRKQIGYVQQNTVIFEGSLADNLKIYSPTATEEEMWNVLKKCGMFETVSEWDDGVYTDLLKGSRLSGGQKQRIAFARILIKNPSIILLDEPTSSLDIETEEQLLSKIKEIFKDKIIIMISHQHRAILKADRIIVMHDGNIAASGSDAELREHSDAYKHLFYMFTDKEV